MKRYEESLFTVRFVGPKLDTVGVGIYRAYPVDTFTYYM